MVRSQFWVSIVNQLLYSCDQKKQFKLETALKLQGEGNQKEQEGNTGLAHAKEVSMDVSWPFHI